MKQVLNRHGKEFTMVFVGSQWELYNATSVHYFKTAEALNEFLWKHGFKEKS